MSISYFSPDIASDGQAADPLILIVDDDKAVCELTGSMLELRGYSVVCASTGLEAMTLFRAYGVRIKLLVTDIMMPTMSGPILAQRLRVLRPGLPVLFVSGTVSYSNSPAPIEGWFLGKPYTQRLLVNKIHEMLSGPT
jgi:CheY-like chemotaxis protein